MNKVVRYLAVVTVTLLLFSYTNAQQKGRRAGQSPKIAKNTTPDDAYIGQYLLPDRGFASEISQRTITITKEDNKLFAVLGFTISKSKHELSLLSDEKFINKSRGFSITFIRDASGRVPQLIYSENDYPDERVIANRISLLVPYVPKRQKLLEYVGRYQPEGRGPFTNITIDGSELFVDSGRTLKNGEVQKVRLVPDTEDRFLTLHRKRDSISFIRDARGKITHFILEEENGSKTTFRKM